MLALELLSSPLPWPTLWITILTHGNEIVWLDIARYLKALSLLRWKIYIILVNIEAYEKYTQQNDPLKFRYVNHDMNRIWDDSYVEWSYEYQRREELKPILSNCDVVVDVHSVSLGEDILGIADENSLESAQIWMDVEKILVQSTQSSSLTAWCTRQWKMSFWLEAGNHISSQWKESWIRNIRNMLIYFGMINGAIERCSPNTETLEFLEEVRIHTDEFRYAEDFKSFNVLIPWQVIGHDWSRVIKNEYPFSVIYGIVAKSPKKWGGAGFLFKQLIKGLD